MKRIASWFRRHLLVRISIQRGLVLRPGDTVLIGVTPHDFAALDFKSIQARLEQRHPGIKFLYVADLGRVFVLGGHSGDEEGNKSGEGGCE